MIVVCLESHFPIKITPKANVLNSVMKDPSHHPVLFQPITELLFGISNMITVLSSFSFESQFPVCGQI